MDTKKFRRNKEDFICENCNQENFGDGYTNHCSDCLYSKHVDINPGDRAEDCHGLMKPIETFHKNSQYFIKHKCLKCGHIKNNKVSKNDSFDKLIEISVKE